MDKYIDYNRIYRTYGELGFPRAERVYFDHLGHEFSYNSKRQKLLDIGYLLWHGYDVRADIHHTYSDAHLSVSEYDVRQTLYILLAELWGGRPEYVEQKFRCKSMDGLIDELFTAILLYYHLPNNHYQSHYLKDPLDMDKWDIINTNPWAGVASKYVTNLFLYSKDDEYVCEDDRPFIEAYNEKAKHEPTKFNLHVPAYPWYGNPLTAKVIVLSLNPGYDDKESTIARIIQNLPQRLTEGYTEHLRKMLTFETAGFLPSDEKRDGISYRDLANLHQRWYWETRLKSAFESTELPFEIINERFAVVEYIGYSSMKKPGKMFNPLLPSQQYTKQLIQYILHNNKDTVFIVARSVNEWKQFLGSLWESNKERFIVSNAYLGQHFTEKSLEKDGFDKIIKAFKS